MVFHGKLLLGGSQYDISRSIFVESFFQKLYIWSILYNNINMEKIANLICVIYVREDNSINV